ncbi:glycosyltransferase family 4 protein [Anaerolineae bacterium CFX7]|nr:glycosyltransferase family 4 protein [Anaerolineae bacterium CFX7]
MLETWGHVRPVWSLCRLIREHQIDIVYTNSVMVLEGALAARHCRVPHIWHLKEWIGSQARVKFWLSDPMLVRFIQNLSTQILVMTRFIGEIFERQNMYQRIAVVNDGVNVASFCQEPKGRVLRRELGVPDDALVVGMAASLSSVWKQHSVFIEMAARLADHFPHLWFVAFGPEPRRYRNPTYNQPWRYYQGLKDQVTRLGLNNKFIWAGFHGDIPQMMDAMDILVHPCAQEPFGRVAIEAMAAQRPVVGPNTGGIAESVVNGETGFLVPAGDVTGFADATARLMRDPDLRQRMGAAGRAHVAKYFSLEQHVAQISSLYNEILKR